jgi:ketosteroid isomerase-like protein
MARSVAAALFILMATSPALAAGEDDLIAIEKDRSAAIAGHNAAYLEALYADDFAGVTALGYQVNKSELMQVFGRDNPGTKFRLDDLKAKIMGDVAVVTGRLTGADSAGKTISQSLYLHVYQKQEGRWRIVRGQGTVVPLER